MKLAVVIPTYNEKETIQILIEKLFSEIKPIVDELHVVIIDDSSPDGTANIVTDLSDKFQKISLIQRPTKLGLGSAYKDGFNHVLEKIDSDLIVQMDADHSHNPSEIVTMLQEIEGYDFVVASRHMPNSSIVGWGVGRQMTHSFAGIIARISARIDIKDSTSGFRMFKRETLQSIEFDKIESDGFAFQIEMLYQLKQKGFRGLEMPTIFVNRKSGKSKMGGTEIMQFIKTCFSYIGKK
ncbi:MAG: polyprenol monophosphomannose synthase [Thermoproteota archaeon]|nr:polyprenol monophosphomannose synthase [Thermoproteota archaeon]